MHIVDAPAFRAMLCLWPTHMHHTASSQALSLGLGNLLVWPTLQKNDERPAHKIEGPSLTDPGQRGNWRRTGTLKYAGASLVGQRAALPERERRTQPVPPSQGSASGKKTGSGSPGAWLHAPLSLWFPEELGLPWEWDRRQGVGKSAPRGTEREGGGWRLGLEDDAPSVFPIPLVNFCSSF